MTKSKIKPLSAELQFEAKKLALIKTNPKTDGLMMNGYTCGSCARKPDTIKETYTIFDVTVDAEYFYCSNCDQTWLTLRQSEAIDLKVIHALKDDRDRLERQYKAAQSLRMDALGMVQDLRKELQSIATKVRGIT